MRKRNIATTTVLSAAMLAGNLGVAMPEASAAANWNVYQTFHVRNYNHVIRYGDNRWGYIHVKNKHGWNRKTPGCISDALRTGEQIHQGGKSWRFELRDGNTVKYTVVYQYGKNNQGVITAFGDTTWCGWVG